LRGGEWIIGGASVALLLSMFLLPWYGDTSVYAPTEASLGRPTNFYAWNSLQGLRWLILLTVLVGLVVWWLQSTRPAPALPVCFTVIETVLAVLLLLALIYRVLVNQPGASSVIEAKTGAYAGLVFSAAIVVGGYLSLREDGISPKDAPAGIETLRLLPRTAGGGR
jgi:hypothetical protein